MAEMHPSTVGAISSTAASELGWDRGLQGAGMAPQLWLCACHPMGTCPAVTAPLPSSLPHSQLAACRNAGGRWIFLQSSFRFPRWTFEASGITISASL